MSCGQFGRGLEPHRRAVAALRQLALERAAQVVDFFVVDEQVAVARQAELVAAEHLHALEQVLRRRPRQWSTEPRSRCRPPPSGSARMRGSERGACTIARSPSRPYASLPDSLHDEVQALVLDARERPRRIEPQRAQHRLDLGREVMLDPGACRRVPVARHRVRRCRLRAARGSSTSLSSRTDPRTSALGARMDGRELLGEAEAVGADCVLSRVRAAA